MRYHYLDNLRAILMLLGVVLHSCAVFSVDKYWVVSYPSSLPWADVLNSTIHLFRMPAFFMIAGFFSVLLLRKKTISAFIKSKLFRIGIPLLTALVIFNLPQQLLLTYLQSAGRTYVNVSSITSHLWFLVNLLAYFAIMCLVYPLLNFVFKLLQERTRYVLVCFVILFIPIFHVALLSLTRLSIPIYESYPLIGSIYGLLLQFDYFLLGSIFYWLFSSELDGLLRQKAWIISGFILFLLKYLVSSVLPNESDSILTMVLNVFTERWHIIGVCMLILTASTYFLNNTNSQIQKIFDASYSIYLIHHLVIVLLSILAIEYLTAVINANALFLIILVATFYLSLGFHKLIVSKLRIAKLMFNGK